MNKSYQDQANYTNNIHWMEDLVRPSAIGVLIALVVGFILIRLF
jgi:hypothetical protein